MKQFSIIKWLRGHSEHNRRIRLHIKTSNGGYDFCRTISKGMDELFFYRDNELIIRLEPFRGGEGVLLETRIPRHRVEIMEIWAE